MTSEERHHLTEIYCEQCGGFQPLLERLVSGVWEGESYELVCGSCERLISTVRSSATSGELALTNDRP
jgi:hypothetical protein